MKQRKLNNVGFTLIEIILSIAILAILLVPALNSFVTAAKVNAKAQKNQKVTTLAQNIMESLKGMDIEETALQFNDGKPFQVLSCNLNGSTTSNYKMKTYVENGYGEYDNTGGVYAKLTTSSTPLSSVMVTPGVGGVATTYSFHPPVNRKIYTFGMENVLDGDIGFDALITLDAEKYGVKPLYETTMNNYSMPNLLELSDKTVAIIDLEGGTTTWTDNTPNNDNSTDKQAISELFNLINLTHQTYHASIPTPTGTPIPIPTPTPIPLQDIKDAIYKDIIINITKDEVQKKVTVICQVIYSCQFDLNDDGVKETYTLPTFEIAIGTYPIPSDSPIENHVYLFYTPSEFTNRDDFIKISNSGVKSNIYIANQQESTTMVTNIIKTDTGAASTAVYTNLKSTQINATFPMSDYNLVTKSAKEDRIYNITVTIFKAGSIASRDFSKPYTTFTSTREE